MEDTVCVCSHWYEEHDGDWCNGCDAGGNQEPSHVFEYSPEENTPEALAWRQ